MNSFVIPLKDMARPFDVSIYMCNMQTKYYTYGFHITEHGIVNYGMTCDNEWKENAWGNRLYRKAGGINGWDTKLECTSALKMAQLMKKYLPTVVKDEVSIIVHDYTHDLQNKTLSEVKKFLCSREHDLVMEHINIYGESPILNIKKTYSYPIPDPTVLDNLFYLCA